MARKHSVWVLVGLVPLLAFTNAHAFDGQRRGFIIGIGAGISRTSFTQDATFDYRGHRKTVRSDREHKEGAATDFKIGYAWDNSWAVYYTSKVSWFNIQNALGNEVTIANGLGAVAVTHWLKPQAPSGFVAGGLGYSTWSLPFEDHAPDTWFGPGLFVGGGYEFARHWSWEGYLAWGRPKDTESGIEFSAKTFSIMLSVNVLGY
jgi:hypothetical protein